MLHRLMLLTACLAISSVACAQKVTLATQDKFPLIGEYFQPKAPTDKAVLMLHQCNYNRTMYDEIGKNLAEKGIHALSIDFRSYGESVKGQMDQKHIRALPESDRDKVWDTLWETWQQDTQVAYALLQSKFKGKGTIGIIGASCGGSQGLALMEKKDVKAMSYFSSGQNEERIARYKKQFTDMPTLIIAAKDDGFTYLSAQKLFELATNPNSKLIAYSAGGHGYPLLAKDPSLAGQIATWFSEQL